MKRSHVVAGAMLLTGFLMGRGAARALDLDGAPATVEATTTVGLTPEPAEGAGTPEDDEEAEADDEEEAHAEPAAAPSPAESEVAAPSRAATTDALKDVDEDAFEAGRMAPQPTRRAGHWQVGAELKKALDTVQIRGGSVTAVRDGKRVPTTLRPDLQETAQNLLSDYDVPAGAVVLLDPRTGEILAMTAHAEDRSYGRELAVLPLAPAASIFKIVTGAALLDKGVSEDHRTCYVGGLRRVRSRDLKNTSPRRGTCVTFSQAMARSANIPFARMTQDYLSHSDLSKWANLFLFNQPLPMGVPASTAEIPKEPGLDFASTGAGFGDVRMSALHGALIAASVGNNGVMPQPVLWKGTSTSRGHRVLTAQQAEVLGDMMELTVSKGTARRAFRERRRYVLGDIKAAGKTGSLAEQGPFRDYSWFVGYAPADKPTVAVATFVMNNAQWRIRASYVGREMLANALIKGHHTYRPTQDVARR